MEWAGRPKGPSDRGEVPRYQGSQGLLAASENVEAVEGVVDPVEVQNPATAAPAEVRDEEVADGITQNRTGQNDVLLAPQLCGDLCLVVQQVLRVGEAEVGLEANRALAHLLATDVVLALLQEGDELEVLDLELERGDILDHAPLLLVAVLVRVLGDELGDGEREQRGLTADRLEASFDDCLKRRIESLRIEAVSILLPHLPLDLVKLAVDRFVQVAFDDGRHDTLLWYGSHSPTHYVPTNTCRLTGYNSTK